MQIARRISAVLLSLVVLSGTLMFHTPAYAGNTVASEGNAHITNTNSDSIRVRGGAGTSFDVKGSVSEGDSVWILEGPVTDSAGHKWYRVSFGAHVGWVDGRYVAK